MANQQFETVEDMVMESLSILKEEGEVIELRVLNSPKGTISGYFNNIATLADYVGKYDETVPAIYVTLNPVKPDLLARANNRVIERAKQTTSDADIQCRRWFPIDFDPIRPAGISSTDEEHRAALSMAKEVKEVLSDKGWGDPIFADSGNGAHLLYAINLPNDNATCDLIKAALNALDFQFSNEQVSVDTSTFNAARIWKLYGTTSCKGDDTDLRPHRLSRILSFPEKIDEVTVKQLEQLANHSPNLPDMPKKSNHNGDSEVAFDLETFIKEHKIGVALKGPWQHGSTKYVLYQCPWNEAHTNKSAYLIQFSNGAIAAGCHHNSCSEENWQSLRKKLDSNFEQSKSDDTQQEKQADILIRLGSQAEFLENELEEAYAAVMINGHKEIWKVKSKKFKMWLTKQFYEETGKAPSSDAMNQAIGVMEMKAAFDGEEHSLHLRVAEKAGKFYYDLADDSWRVVEIEPDKCNVLIDPPMLFTRNKNLKAQAEPNFDGDLKLLLDHVRIKKEDDQILYLVYLVTCFIPNIPHVVLVFSGEKGASKSTSMRMTRQIVDPAVRDLLTMPNSLQDLALSLANNYMPSFDNLDGLSAEKSDLLCIASTGGGFSKRTLWTDEDETLLDIRRCVGLTGINVVVTRADLIDRSVIIELDRIPEEERKEESQLWSAFDADKPSVVGGALRVLSEAMAIYPEVKLDKLPRMQISHVGVMRLLRC